MIDRRFAHRTALAAATEWVGRVGPDDLTRPTPCGDWDLAALLAHLVGQHEGFAAAVRDGDAPADAYAPVPYSRERWDASVAGLLEAFAAADLAATAREIELAPDPLPVEFLVTAQLLDTVVHTWDVARALGEWYEPPADVATDLRAVSERIPDGDGRERPGAAFAHARAEGGSDWERTLALLGRDPAR